MVHVGKLLMRAPLAPVQLGPRCVRSNLPLEDNMEGNP